jgi:foldase protein PrsA
VRSEEVMKSVAGRAPARQVARYYRPPMKTRWSIPALGAFFVVIALVIAGCGASGGVPANSVASVAGNPITKRALDHWLYVDEKSQSASEPGQPVIVPNDPPGFSSCIAEVRKDFTQYKKTPAKTIQGLCSKLFTELNTTVLGFLIESYQYQAEAHKLGITVTTAQVQKQLNTEKKSQFKTPAEYAAYLKESGYTNADVLYRTRVVAIYKKLAARHMTKVTPADISAYYAAHKSTFGTPETRNMRIVLAKTASQAKTALAALKSGQSWTVVAKKYSTDPTTKDKGGLLTDVAAGQQDAALSKAAFAAPLNKLEGPIKGQFGYYVLDVIKITPAVQQSLAKVTPQIKSTLNQQQETKTQTAVNAAVKKDFGSRTLCAKEYSIALCKGYKAPATSSTTASGATGTTPATSPATSSATTPASSSATASSSTTTSSASQ